MMACPAAAMAQNVQEEWALVEPQSGTQVLMDKVGFLLAADGEDSFSVVCTDGTVIYGAKEINFALVDPTSIATAKRCCNTPMLEGCIDGRLTLTGCKPGTEGEVYDTGGRKVRNIRVMEGKTIVDVTGLPSGVYMLRTGETSVKFLKK